MWGLWNEDGGIKRWEENNVKKKKNQSELSMWRARILSIKENHVKKKKTEKNKVNAWDRKQGMTGITKIRDLPSSKTGWIIGWVQKAELSSSREGRKAHSVWSELTYLCCRACMRRNQLN